MAIFWSLSMAGAVVVALASVFAMSVVAVLEQLVLPNAKVEATTTAAKLRNGNFTSVIFMWKRLKCLVDKAIKQPIVRIV
ncbi:hypothetical protein [Hymenobacter sp. UV11]|uniref:hypothetical protein n=1 Tax=Hymenobacter sp. UV11 TaxID=1849735 RepID=UPI0014152D4C|nr:hypothetical protein [Hymenobacter sp. UV11]